MVGFLTNSSKMKRMLIGYWVLVPMVFLFYLAVTASLQSVSIDELLFNIPSLTVTSIVSFLLIFQLSGLLCLTRSMDNKHSLLGIYLLFNFIQQVLISNFIGAILCFLYYKSLNDSAEKKQLAKLEYWMIYGLIFFVSALSFVVIWVRFLLT